MIVPQFWAEGRLQHREKGRQITLRRFGWSDLSLTDAQANADARVKEALQRVLSGEKLPRRDPKVAYNGTIGVPIREEIVARHGDIIITRNSYGARCLNASNVLFADVDFSSWPPLWYILVYFGGLILSLSTLNSVFKAPPIGVVILSLFTFLLWTLLAVLLFPSVQVATGARGNREKAAKQRIEKFLSKHPEWNLRLYRTPAGLRILATHKPFKPGEPDVEGFFQAIQTDSRYVALCLHQQCFRARVSAKPWRAGMSGNLHHCSGVWPVAHHRMANRNAWIANYENAAKSYAACLFLTNRGSGEVHPTIRPVLELHDQLCNANSNLPMA